MLSPQVLSKGDQSAILRPDRLTTSDGRRITHIPLAAIQEVRPDGDTVLTIVLTDGVPRRLTGGNAYAASAFLTALTAALPEQRDPAGSALITTEEGGSIIKVWQVWCGALALYHPNGKRAGWYKYTDTSGNEHTTGYGANRATEEIHVVYDAESPTFSLAAEPLSSTVVKHVLGGGASLTILGLGLWGVLAPYI
ncbi:hypothetical protein AB0B13_07700 [Streptomyces sp. NPDC042898]|uniref:hypothetical protein n=1 Tax=Streptomyces sp. NPDC042898 TaxID=3154334 RepID=UPI0033D31B3E